MLCVCSSCFLLHWCALGLHTAVCVCLLYHYCRKFTDLIHFQQDYLYDFMRFQKNMSFFFFVLIALRQLYHRDETGVSTR